jgi:hypothetical protein
MATAVTTAVTISPAITTIVAASPPMAYAELTTPTLLRPTSFINRDIPPHEVLAVECLNRVVSFLVVRHFDEAKTPDLS